MNKCPADCCQIKRDLDNTDDLFAFLADYHPLSKVLNELDRLSEQELKCAVCLYGSALLKLNHKYSLGEKLKMMFRKNKREE